MNCLQCKTYWLDTLCTTHRWHSPHNKTATWDRPCIAPLAEMVSQTRVGISITLPGTWNPRNTYCPVINLERRPAFGHCVYILCMLQAIGHIYGEPSHSFHELHSTSPFKAKCVCPGSIETLLRYISKITMNWLVHNSSPLETSLIKIGLNVTKDLMHF